MEIVSISTLLFLTFIVHPAASTTACGVKKSSNRIVGGHDSGGYHYPWFALLVLKENENFPVCAGSLITTRHVLTAAHCFTIKPSTPKEKLFTVLMGVYDRCNSNESTRQAFAVTHVDVHEEYHPGEKFHDIALITLERATTFNVICLPIPGMADVTEPAILIGFGVTKEGGKKSPCHMMEATVTKYSKRDCKGSDLPAEDVNESTVICAGTIRGGIDSCNGDSGGPLQIVTSSGNYVIAGIVSFGYGCANPGLPGLYTDVASYLNWIGNKVSEKSTSRNRRLEFFNRRVTTQTFRKISAGSEISFPEYLPDYVRRYDASAGAVSFPTDQNSNRTAYSPETGANTAKASPVIFPNDRK